MNICEATKKAVEINGYITRDFKDIPENAVFIKPTDTENNCILTLDISHFRRGWQPCASDLMSESWKVVTEKEFLSLLDSISTIKIKIKICQRR